jgi:MFS family permease
LRYAARIGARQIPDGFPPRRCPVQICRSTWERTLDTETNHVNRLLVAKGLRAFGDGYVSLLLPLYLLGLGFSPLYVGIIATTTLVGSGLLTLAVGLHAWRYHYRSLLLAASVLMALTGFGFAFFTQFWPLLLVALVGTLNPSSGDVSVFLPLEHAVLARVVSDRQRTATFARYSLVGSLLAAAGSLAAALPATIVSVSGVSSTQAIQAMFALYALIACAAGFVYRGLPGALAAEVQQPVAPLQQSKKKVYTLAALFSLDAFAGRFGLVNTMVYTHIPSSVCLILLPFVPNVAYAIALLFVRSALSQMDVPTRSSYVMAIVTPAERPAAASITSVPRSLASALSPFLAGWMLGLSSFGWPLVVAGGVKIAYDLLLLALFRKVRPPEEEN